MTTLQWQYIQRALHLWRQRNPWADEIPFDQFPKKYRDAIELAAHINQNN